jgi:hypothetical protein
MFVRTRNRALTSVNGALDTPSMESVLTEAPCRSARAWLYDLSLILYGFTGSGERPWQALASHDADGSIRTLYLAYAINLSVVP